MDESKCALRRKTLNGVVIYLCVLFLPLMLINIKLQVDNADNTVLVFLILETFPGFHVFFFLSFEEQALSHI